MKKWLLLMLLAASGLANAAIELGKDYTMLSTPQPVADPKKVEVIEFFSYHCIHCYDDDPAMNAWAKTQPADVSFRKEQIVWQKSMEGFARMFATFKATGTFDKLHRPAFDAQIKQRINLADPAEFTKWIKQQKGIDSAKLLQTYNSFGINAQVARAAKITRDYQIQGTPTIIVNGKYVLVTSTPERMTQVLNELIAKARAEKK
ncbi:MULTISPECIES: thiol:disulfide interchange protein DsbA/DsbL [Chromobacterium]|jgi:thiol:disulfide interchange protein DsbA|uniref:Thiol:disulfide interchange protein n=2 Tax=Chromobacterium TaxID=535 RepID=A0A2S9X0U1_9NEIS|nr:MULTISPECIES: thiol:disulfide interchange protein DsbA/DsbL [Chromobacterium]KIA82268.1 thiol:disulfide interchange protein DsbA [Chromobacterium piscinae]MBM2882835.1 thiol:disulfide interchange protein DsbA/DsbL [Chromobacterium amazonense]MDE1713155.1 thiol:disulfide interchange protein DsbA/DsbL [Chromobacterium amazonense]MDQ4539591.1 thiol:disulfide interchange protein DsbA/DsbL [Chromobacterium amazonense]POA99675.1 thiol:disulfide interchange protein DsbA/DsbL [Chromobacterium sinus